MEIKRKKITTQEIYAEEQKFAEQVSEICKNKNPDFKALGYELDLEFGQKENEAQSRFEVFSNDETKKFESGYISRAMITVKRQKTEAELAEDDRLIKENQAMIEACETAEEAEQLENDEALRKSEDDSKRSVAFTCAMLVRAYKSFWTEWVCLGDDLNRLEADLSEFLDILEQKQTEDENS
ncbi:MAG: hypothetical protein E7603_01420 [Ruminococcaceae bacterium]|nr:hypothetical protein [Oscillospiraceae bacterium]